MAIRQRQRRLTADDLRQVAERYSTGATVYELAAEFGCHRATIAERLKLAGVAMQHKPTTIEQVDEIVRLYRSGLSMVKVADQVGVSARTVFNYLQRGVSQQNKGCTWASQALARALSHPECGLNG